LWTVEDDLLFLKYVTSKRDKCYHAIAKDSSCRPSEILRMKVKDVVFKFIEGRQYAEILVNGKTGTRHIPLINSIPYLKDYLEVHPCKTNPHIPLICSRKGFKPLTAHLINNYYRLYKTIFFPKLLKDPRVSPEDKQKITVLLQKPWNPYVFRHSALTEKSKILKEHILRQHAGWTSSSDMPEKYLHYFGNESSMSILEAYGLKTKTEDINRMKPVQCPNCTELNEVNSKFCRKCRYILSYDVFEEPTDIKRIENIDERIKALELKYSH
jgi:integrase/recombinase XerD